VGSIERELGRMLVATRAGGAPRLRTSVMTHLAWVPPKWLRIARATLAGMGERHPSRTLLLVPHPRSKASRIDADLAVECYPLRDAGRSVCSEVVELHLHGDRAGWPASVVEPLLISDLPVFCRWRGEPDWDGSELEQLVSIADRLVFDSSEWPTLPDAYAQLAVLFEALAVSDLAWARTRLWRGQIAGLWPAIESAHTLRVRGPEADALLLLGWLRSRLGEEDVELEYERADAIEVIAVDGNAVERAPGVHPTGSDLLSVELDRLTRDPVYEASVLALVA
jgi:glucose-6-phosphate dehydrogenase assembly protein OpcA